MTDKGFFPLIINKERKSWTQTLKKLTHFKCMQVMVWRIGWEDRTFSWRRWWLFGSWLFGAKRPQPFHLMDHLNLSSFFHPSPVTDLIYLDSCEDDDDNDKEITIQRVTAKISTVKNVLATAFSEIYILILCFLNHVFLKFLYASIPTSHLFLWENLLWYLLTSDASSMRLNICINLSVLASFQPLSEHLHFQCCHLPQMNQDQSRVRNGKMG